MEDGMATQEMIIAALLKAAALGLPPDIQEVLVRGNPTRGIPAGILGKMLDAANAADTCSPASAIRGGQTLDELGKG